MRLSLLCCAALLLTVPAATFAQNANPLTANAKIQFGALTGFVIRSAEKVPEDLYSFRATPEVRSMAELFGHVADAMFSMCAPPSLDIYNRAATHPHSTAFRHPDWRAYVSSI